MQVHGYLQYNGWCSCQVANYHKLICKQIILWTSHQSIWTCSNHQDLWWHTHITFQLGAIPLTGLPLFGRGNAPIVTSYIWCTGYERSLGECYLQQVSPASYSYYSRQVASVICLGCHLLVWNSDFSKVFHKSQSCWSINILPTEDSFSLHGVCGDISVTQTLELIASIFITLHDCTCISYFISQLHEWCTITAWDICFSPCRIFITLTACISCEIASIQIALILYDIYRCRAS